MRLSLSFFTGTRLLFRLFPSEGRYLSYSSSSSSSTAAAAAAAAAVEAQILVIRFGRPRRGKSLPLLLAAEAVSDEGAAHLGNMSRYLSHRHVIE